MRRATLLRTVAAAALLGCAAPDPAVVPPEPIASALHTFRLVPVAHGLSHAWGLAFLPDGGILVTERAGRLRLVRDGALLRDPVEGVPPVFARGQGGLLDVAVHPDFDANGLVYLSYAKPGARGATTAVIRGRLENDRLHDVQEILEADAWGGRPVHFGSRLVFDGAGHLFVTVGERGEMERAQRLSDHAGTTLRVHDDGRVPADNPFVGRPDARPEIWTYGNRNPQGLALHPERGELWQTEHGPRGGDELNVLRAGRNYGWPAVTHGVNYTGTRISEYTALDGMEGPLLHWTPSIAVAGMTIYDGERFPRWRGDVFVAALAGGRLVRIRFDGLRPVAQEALLVEYGQRLRQVATGPDGLLYLLVDADGAPLLRLEPAGP